MPDKLLQQFQERLKRLSYPMPSDKVLVAYSGGPDSTALVHLFVEAGFSPSIAHCNFGLRGKASDEDAAFCKAKAKELGLQYHQESFALSKGQSIQEEARELRYKWFENLAQQQGYRFIATAHHLEDQAETILHRFIRGAGVRGLTGIPEKRGKFIRPLLFASKELLLAYLEQRQIAYRKDSSNEDSDYTRNFIRHQILPQLEELNPAIKNSLAERSQDYQESALLFEVGLKAETRKLLHQYKGFEGISMHGLLKHPAGTTILFEWLKDFGFDRNQVKTIFDSLPLQPGKRFESANFSLLVQRKLLLLVPNSKAADQSMLIDGIGTYHLGNRRLSIEAIPTSKIPGKPSPDTLFIPQDEGLFPLIWRKWKAGDFFYPEGLTKASGQPARKKLSDFLTDEKLEPIDRECQTVLESGEKILWVVGKRKDARVGKTGASEKSWRIRFSEKS